MAPNENVSRVRVAMYESRNENLLSKGSHHVLYDFVLVETKPCDLRFICDFNTVDPFSN